MNDSLFLGETQVEMSNRKVMVSNIRADWLPAATLTIYTVAVSITTFYLTIFFKETLGYSAFRIGLLFSAQALVGILAAFPAGAGNDRFSSHTIITVSLVVQAICFVAMSAVKSFLPFILIYMTWGLFSWAFRLSMDVYFLKTDTRNAIGRRIGFFQAWRYLGMAIGTIGTGYIISALNFSGSFKIIAAVCLFLIILSVFMPPTAVAQVSLSAYKADFSNKKVALFSLWMLLFASHWGAEQTCYGLFLRENLQLTFQGMGWYFSGEYLAIILSLLFAGNLIGKQENFRKIAIYGLLASGLGQMGMVLKPVAISVLFRMIHGMGDGFMIVILYSGIARLFSIKHLGGNTGLVHLFSMTGYIIGAMIYSPIGERLGYGHPLWISGLLTVFLMIPLLKPSKRALSTT